MHLHNSISLASTLFRLIDPITACNVSAARLADRASYERMGTSEQMLDFEVLNEMCTLPADEALQGPKQSRLHSIDSSESDMQSPFIGWGVHQADWDWARLGRDTSAPLSNSKYYLQPLTRYTLACHPTNGSPPMASQPSSTELHICDKPSIK